MAAKVYWLKFGAGDPRTYTGLTPTFLQFYDSTGQTYAPPSISEIKYGGVTASGVYGFSYLIGISTQNSIYFLVSSVTTFSTAADGFISGVLDPVLATDQQIGSTAVSSIGSTSVDPSNIYGYLKRIQELLEGDSVFTAATGNWLMYNRTSLGSTTLLRSKTVVNQGSQVTKTGL